MQIDWPFEHRKALREFASKGMSYSQIARAINARFGTAYSRSATIGRARRMGFGERREDRPEPPPTPGLPPLRKFSQRHLSEFIWPPPVFERVEKLELRCAEIEPRHLSLMELGRSDCRYPYGGDEADQTVTFCGHPRRRDSSYCTAHFDLTRGPGTASERTAVPVARWLVEVP